MMQDLNALYATHRCSKTFHNFFKSQGYKDAYSFLKTELTLPESEIMAYTRPTRGRPSQCLAHELIVLEFLHWMDTSVYHRAIMRMMA